MGRQGVRLAELEKLPPEEKEARFRALIEATQKPPNGELEELNARIAEFEARFGVSSAQMAEEVSSGERAETWEICEWFMLLSAREDLVSEMRGGKSAEGVR